MSQITPRHERPSAPEHELEEGEIPRLPNPRANLDQLEEVDLRSLSEEDRDCGICREPYGTGEHPESILRLPCKHYFGSHCIYEWLKPAENEHKNTCPICRAVVFEPRYDSDPERQILPVIRELLTRGTERDLIRAFRIVDKFVSRLPAILSDNRARWEGSGEQPEHTLVGHYAVNPRCFHIVSAQLLAVFEELSRRSFAIPQPYLVRLTYLMGMLWCGLVDLFHLVDELYDQGDAFMWGDGGPPLHVLCDPRFEGMIKQALQQMVSVEHAFILYETAWYDNE